MKVIIFGATGLVGSEVTNLLLSNQKISKVFLLTRKQTNFTSSEKVSEIIIPEITIERVLDLDISADHFICTLGSTIKKSKSKDKFSFVDHDLVVAFAKLCKKCRGKSFHVVSSMGSNKNSVFFYNRTKGKMENSLKELELNSLVIYRPSLLISQRKEFRAGEKIGILSAKIIRPFIGTKLSKLIGTDVKNLAIKINNDIDKSSPGIHYIEANQI